MSATAHAPLHEEPARVVDEDVVVREIKRLDGAALIRLDCPTGFEVAQPGMFVMVRSHQPLAPFLPRPLSIVSATPGEGGLTLLFNVFGAGTKALANASVGEAIQLVGPLGVGFSPPVAIAPLAVVADATHIGTMLALTIALGERASVYFAAAGRPAEPAMIALLEGTGAAVTVGPADGCRPWLAALRPGWAASGGKDPLSRTVQDYAGAARIPAQVALHTMMACGLGVCLACVRERRDGSHFLVCEENIVPAAEPLLAKA